MAEDPTVGALREIEEEAGVEVNLIRLLHVHSQMKEPGTFMISLIFGAVADSEDVTLSPEHSEFRWCTPDEFEELDIPDKYKVAAATFLRSKTAL